MMLRTLPKTPSRMAQIRPKSSHERKSAFQLNPNGREVSMMELETAFELCENIEKKDERDSCYIVFGIDGDAMKKHYPVICSMEKSLYPEDNSFVGNLIKKFNLQK